MVIRVSLWDALNRCDYAFNRYDYAFNRYAFNRYDLILPLIIGFKQLFILLDKVLFYWLLSSALQKHKLQYSRSSNLCFNIPIHVFL